ncbi:MAG: DUF47 family protein [Chloroflexota bacterium]|nr:DUF47 family protein [Chloroflexota bacterium]
MFNFLKSADGDFFQMFEDAAGNMLLAAQSLRELCYNYSNAVAMAERIHEYEHIGDEIGHRMYAQLNKSFVTPLDREDIIGLYSSIDNVTDFVHSAVDMMAVYRVDKITPIAQQLSDCIVGCCEEVVKAVPHLRKRNELDKIQEPVIQINSLENKADDLLREGLSELFANPTDLLHVIKWRDIYQEMEEATDKAEDIADVLRGLALKHA